MTLSDRIEQARRNRGLSQARLAILVGTQQGTVSRWEEGKYRPSIEQLERVAEVCEVDVAWLLVGREPPVDLPEDERIVLDVFRALGLTKDQAIRGLSWAAAHRDSGSSEAAMVLADIRDTEHQKRLQRPREAGSKP